MKLDTLYYLSGDSPADCPFQMAVDEALFHYSIRKRKPVVRFYQWSGPAITFGYSEPFPEIQGGEPIRRYTGGGQVEHGNDLTFLLTLPRDTGPASLSPHARYRWIHEAILKTLKIAGLPLIAEELPENGAVGPCFENPVSWDLLSPTTGRKIVGGAQRRSRGNIIHQGSIRVPEPLLSSHQTWTSKLLEALSDEILPFPENDLTDLFKEAKRLSKERYTTAKWNRKRQATP